MYPDDFNTSEAAFAPVTDGLFVGISPLIVLLGLALLGLAAWAGWAWARMDRGGRGPSPRAVATSIHAAVQRKLNAALAAHGGATTNAAQALVDEIDIRLGKVLKLAGDTGKANSALKDAIAGKSKPTAPPPPPSPAPPSTTPHAVIIPIPGQGAGSSAAAASGAGGVGAVAASDGGGLVGAVLHLPPAPPVPPTPPSPSPAQHVASVRAALEEFAAHWGTGPSDPASDARIAELEAAADQLSTEIPAPKIKHPGHI